MSSAIFSCGEAESGDVNACIASRLRSSTHSSADRLILTRITPRDGELSEVVMVVDDDDDDDDDDDASRIDICPSWKSRTAARDATSDGCTWSDGSIAAAIARIDFRAQCSARRGFRPSSVSVDLSCSGVYVADGRDGTDADAMCRRREGVDGDAVDATVELLLR